MKSYILTFVLAVLVVLTGVNLRRAIGGSPAPFPPDALTAIGGSPAPFPPDAVTRTQRR